MSKMDSLDREIFLNTVTGAIGDRRRISPEKVHLILMQAAGVAIHPTVRESDVPMYCAASISTAINEERNEDVKVLLGRVFNGTVQSIDKRRHQ